MLIRIEIEIILYHENSSYSMIERFHDDFFELESGEKAPFFEFPAPKSKKIIVQHSFIPFDPLGGGLDYLPRLIYNKTIQVVDYKGDVTFIDLFEKHAEQKACLKKDYILWWWTGYWTILKNKQYFIGSGLDSLKNAIGGFGNGKASYCLSNRDSIIIINFEFNRGLIENGIIFDFFITNAYLPYVETINPFLIAIAEIGKFYCISEKKIKITDIFKTKSATKGFDSPMDALDRTIKTSLQPRKFILNPIAYIRNKEGDVALAVIKNEFSTNLSPINSVKYLIGSCAGGFIETDFTGDKEFNIYSEIIFLNNNIVMNTYFHAHAEFESMNETIKVLSDNDVLKMLEGKKDKIKVRDSKI
jgi:hypothetical protein